MMRTVMRVSVQASISAIQMSANSLKYVTSVFTGCSSHRGVDRELGAPAAAICGPSTLLFSVVGVLCYPSARLSQGSTFWRSVNYVNISLRALHPIRGTARRLRSPPIRARGRSCFLARRVTPARPNGALPFARCLAAPKPETAIGASRCRRARRLEESNPCRPLLAANVSSAWKLDNRKAAHTLTRSRRPLRCGALLRPSTPPSAPVESSAGCRGPTTDVRNRASGAGFDDARG
jgi:hypothetical protein